MAEKQKIDIIRSNITNYSLDIGEEYIQQLVDALLADETFMDSLDELIDDAEQAQMWVEAIMQEQGEASAGKISTRPDN